MGSTYREVYIFAFENSVLLEKQAVCQKQWYAIKRLDKRKCFQSP